jgi:hypothetical protein
MVVCGALWLVSYLVAAHYTFRPTSGRWCQVGINYGTVYLATDEDSSRPARGLLVYGARDQGVSVYGLATFVSWNGTAPPGPMNVAIVSMPLWPTWVAIAIAALVIWREGHLKERVAGLARSGRCCACGYDLRTMPARCPECGAVAPPYRRGVSLRAIETLAAMEGR